ncbi:MAG: hypothetical protein ACLP9D_03515 [Candidatus Bathyarchaeia archaeon]
MAKKKEAVPGRVVVLSTVLVIMVVLATLVSLDVGVQSGWKIPGIGSVGFGTGSNSTGSGTVTTTGTSGSNYVTCTQTSCPPNSILPSGQVEFNMKLLAVYTDGTNSSIANQQGIPNLAQISFNGKPLDHIDTQALVGYVSSLPLPPGSTATYVVNETALNSKTNYMTWHSFNYETGFVDNNTVSLFLLPDFKMPAVQVYSDVCNTNSTGGVTCNLPANTPQTRQVTWNVIASVTVAAPAQFAVLPFTVSNIAVSAGNFGADNIVGCTNCGSSPPAPIAATVTGSTATVITNKDITKPTPKEPPTVTETTNPEINSATGQGCLMLLPSFSLGPCGESLGGNTKGGDGSNTAGSGKGTFGGGQVKIQPCAALLPTLCLAGGAVSLLPVNYVPLSFGSFEVVNPWALLFFAIIWVAVAAGILAIVVLARSSGKTKRKRS